MLNAHAPLTLLDACPDTGPAGYGKKKLLDVLRSLGCRFDIVKDIDRAGSENRICIGLTGEPYIQALLKDPVSAPEGVLIKTVGKPSTLVIAGTDARGLMYALLEMAQHLEAEGFNGLNSVVDTEAFPENRVRGVDRYVMGHLDNGWFLSATFWSYFLSRLAENRFNRFTLILGFDTAYLTPPYPFFVNVPGFSRVHAVSEEERQNNLNQLRQIGNLCHAYGLEFFLGTWQQTPWTAAQKNLVDNLPSEEQGLAEYCAGGMTTLLNACDAIDGVQLRVNFEAGVGSQTSNDAFWMGIVDAVAAVSRPVTLSIRAKGMSDNLLAYARGSGLKFEVPTKHWCEHTGLPYHLTRMRTEEINNLANLNHSRRYSYADLLRKPQQAELLYRLWNYGSTCLFTWGDPDYARRFSHSCQMGGSGFEVDAALSLQYGQERLQREPWSIYDEPNLNSPDWEDERHWFRYVVYGRLGYSTKTSARVWQREFEKRFGVEAAPLLERAYAASGKVMPLITAVHMPVHPSQHYWPEMSTGAALFAEHNYNKHYGKVSYGSTEPSDPGLFYGIDEYVTDLHTGALKGKYTPVQVIGWFKQLAQDILEDLAKLAEIKSLSGNLEYRQAAVDLQMNAHFALYHAWKMSAAYHLAHHKHSGDVLELQRAFAFMAVTAKQWDALVEVGAVFHNNLEFGIGESTDRHGHWRDRKGEIEKDLARLAGMLNALPDAAISGDAIERMFRTEDKQAPARWVEMPAFRADWPNACPAGEALELAVETDAPLAGALPQLRYRHTNQMEGEFKTLDMARCEKGYRAVIPGTYVDQAWDLLVYVTRVESDREVTVFPGIYHPAYPAPYHRIVVT